MSFSFNWAGVTMPQINVAKTTEREDAEKFGAALKGYRKSVADKEYAEMLNGVSNNDAQIIDEINRLEARNAEIRRMLGGISG